MGRRWFLVFFIATSSIVSAEPVIYVLKGRPVIVETPVTDPPDEILWKHNGNKVVEYDGKQQYVYGSYKERVVLDWSSAQLEIQDLTYEDSGEYVLEVFKSTNLRQIIYKVEVIDNVAKPTISCQMNESSSSNTHGNEATLNCFVESRQPLSLLKFEWIIDGNIQPGPKLAITLGGAHDNEEYKCRVSNPLSSEMATFTTKDCYADKPNVAVILIALLIVLAGICVLALVLGVVLWKLRKHKGSNKDTTQNKDCDPLLSPDAEKPREPGPSNSEETTEPDPAGNNDSENPTTTDGSKKTTIQNDENIPLKPPVNVKNLIDAFEPKSQEPGPSNSEETTEPDPAGSNKDTTQNKDCDPLLSPDPEKMSDEESCLDSSQKNGNMEILKNSDELKTGAYSDQVTGETLENVGVCNSLGFRKINDPDDNAASQNDPETTAYVQDSVLSQKESSTTVNDHKERDKSPSEDVNESAHYQEQIEAGKNFPLNTPQKLLIPPKPPRHISALPITNASHADPEKGGKTRHDSQKEQSDSSTTQVEKCDCEGEAVDDEGQGSPTEEQLHRQQE
ncbi:CD48 antigen BCM1 surface antigen BLAST-1 MRC OX-45 surface antigen SLAM family member 2 [Channa argus]|uniref:CD48 antigen BCM1 surface antigen BLAST-1 MRC OX-45 surface antigen SLAM family member 2 n=1 Tax=Channa argus TaxID=215402 RepID=A0A6G1PWY1_CHAAH|nr:CD48 antigen BCM1 surface antigen BLAST-1 MRC OX-45 surface antigen SLAM family member 2 [Channa argus]